MKKPEVEHNSLPAFLLAWNFHFLFTDLYLWLTPYAYWRFIKDVFKQNLNPFWNQYDQRITTHNW